MQMLRIRTKVEVIIVTSFLILIGVYSVFAVTRTISDTQDTIELYIINSNGKMWEATGANIQNAIDDIGIDAEYQGFGTPHGWVKVPGNTSITVSNEIEIKDHVTLDLQGSELVYDSNVNCILMRVGASLQNGIINVSQVTNFDKTCVHYNCDGSDNSLAFRNHLPFVYNMKFVSSELRGTAIYLNTSPGYDWTSNIVNTFYDIIQIEGFEYALYINHSRDGSDDSYINGNRFTNVDIVNCKYPITVYNYDLEAAGNIFSNVNVYCNASTEYIVWNNGIGNFFEINAYNWDNNSGTRTSYNFSDSIRGAGMPHYPGHQCWINILGGGEDISIGPYRKWTPSNCYVILNRENSSFWIGDVHDMTP